MQIAYKNRTSNNGTIVAAAETVAALATLAIFITAGCLAVAYGPPAFLAISSAFAFNSTAQAISMCLFGILEVTAVYASAFGFASVADKAINRLKEKNNDRTAPGNSIGPYGKARKKITFLSTAVALKNGLQNIFKSAADKQKNSKDNSANIVPPTVKLS